MTPPITKPAFCASCTEVTPHLKPRALGRNEGIVWICQACDGEHPRSGRYSFDDSPGTDRGIGAGNRQMGRRPDGVKR